MLGYQFQFRNSIFPYIFLTFTQYHHFFPQINSFSLVPQIFFIISMISVIVFIFMSFFIYLKKSCWQTNTVKERRFKKKTKTESCPPGASNLQRNFLFLIIFNFQLIFQHFTVLQNMSMKVISFQLSTTSYTVGKLSIFVPLELREVKGLSQSLLTPLMETHAVLFS